MMIWLQMNIKQGKTKCIWLVVLIYFCRGTGVEKHACKELFSRKWLQFWYWFAWELVCHFQNLFKLTVVTLIVNKFLPWLYYMIHIEHISDFIDCYVTIYKATVTKQVIGLHDRKKQFHLLFLPLIMNLRNASTCTDSHVPTVTLSHCIIKKYILLGLL